jgi:hypothetical protein
MPNTVVTDCIVKDKVIQNIISKVHIQKKYMCRFNCGFEGELEEVEKHHYSENIEDCNNKILVCQSDQCNVLSRCGIEYKNHVKECIYVNVPCIFCGQVLCSKEEVQEHFKIYHNMADVMVGLKRIRQV